MKYWRLEYCKMVRSEYLFPGTAPMWRPTYHWNSYRSTHAGSVRELYVWFRGAQYHFKLSCRD